MFRGGLNTNLPENYQRALNISFQLIEEMAVEIEGKNNQSISESSSIIKKKLESIKENLRQIKRDLNLSQTEESASGVIKGNSAACWEILCDLESKRLKRYGECPPELAQYLDPRTSAMREAFKTIAEIASYAEKAQQ